MQKHSLLLTLLFLVSVMTSTAQTTINGKLFDKTLNQPLEFASVALMNTDSTIVTGAMSGTDGSFEMKANAGNYIIKASFIGYKTVCKSLQVTGNTTNAGTLMLEEDLKMLKEVEVKAVLPKTQLKGDAVVTTIEGSVLEHSGNANDVLSKVPGMINLNGTLEVLGRGEPVYYINGRKVTDDSELRNLMSEEMKAVEVVSNPGALYGGDVRCVVRIKTIRRQGDGFGYAITSQAKKYTTGSEFDPSWSVLDLNYRTGGWDFFGKIVYWMNHGFQASDIYGGTNTMKDGQLLSQMQDGILFAKAKQSGIQHIFGANWQISDKHSLGFKIDRSNTYYNHQKIIMDNDFVVNGTVDDHVHSVNQRVTPEGYSWNGNLYYNGNINKLSIDFNADFMVARTNDNNQINETSWAAPVAMESEAHASGNMGAAKLVLSYPIGKGELQAGSEETYAVTHQDYAITMSEIPSSESKTTENTIAGFAQYSLPLSFGQLSAGLRYEYVNFDYTDRINPANDLSRKGSDWFPSLSFATKLGAVGLSLSYTGKTLRPQLHAISSEIMYDNRYTYQSGDPKLKNEKQSTLSLNAQWKWLTFSSTYERVDNGITQWAEPYKDGSVVMLKYSNVDAPYHKLSMYLNASPSFGVYYPRYTIGYSKPYLRMTVTDQREANGTRVVCRNRPMLLLQANNAFRLKDNWQIELNYQFVSKMSHEITNLTRPQHGLDLCLQKSFLKDNALTFNLSWIDILNKTVQHIDVDYGSFILKESIDSRNPGIVLRVSYHFNSADNKYKGSGAGNAVKERM